MDIDTILIYYNSKRYLNKIINMHNLHTYKNKFAASPNVKLNYCVFPF